MANSPIDVVPSIMKEDFGTIYLITDPRSDKILSEVAKHGTARYERWCGGKDGFDDYSERLH